MSFSPVYEEDPKLISYTGIWLVEEHTEDAGECII